MRNPSLAIALLFVTLGCSSSGSDTTSTGHPPRVSDYSTTCATATDCIVIDTSSDPCCGGCGTGAIAKSDEERYKADLQRFRATCSSLAPCPDRRCSSMVAICEGGACKAIAPGVDAGTDTGVDGSSDAVTDGASD